jgi:predicted nucleic acid-binding protein
VGLILDTSVVFASLDRNDVHHARCRTLIDEANEPLLLPAPVFPELDYWLEKTFGVGPMLALLRDVYTGAYRVEDLVPEDYPRVADLMDRYSDSDIGFVDSSIVAIAERLGEPKVATLDHRHFAVVRPRHADAFELLP